MTGSSNPTPPSVHELAANIMAAIRRAKFPKEYFAEAHDEFEATVLVPMLTAVHPSADDGVLREAQKLVAELREAMQGATARPWVAFDSGERKATLAVMKGQRPKPREDGRFVRWPEIIAWSGFDAADVPHSQRRANLHLIVEVVNALPRIIAALSANPNIGGG